MIKILHLEDLPTDTGLVQRELKKGNVEFELTAVDNQEDFEKALKEFSPDIILSDHSLPSFNSIEALKIVRLSGYKMPFILVTATMSEEFAVQMMKAGAHDYILKDRLQRLPGAVVNALEMHRLEVERQKFIEDIIANEALLKETEKGAHIGSFQFDVLTQSTKWSDELFRIFGFQPGEVEPSRQLFLEQVYPADLTHVQKSIDYSGHNLNQLTLEYRLKGENNKVKYVFSKILIKRNDNNEPITSTGFVEDITPIKLAEMEITALNESLEKKVIERTVQLEEVNNELEGFNYTVSHDLRSPLQVINGFASILSMKYGKDLNEDAQTLLKGIKDCTKRMGNIIEDLLYFSRLGHTELVRKEVNIDEQVKTIINELKSAVQDAGAEIKIQNLKPARCDQGLLQHVWVNLISNALKYSGKTQNPVIEIGVKNIAEKDTYYVKDNGVGFDMKHADKLFKVFQRLHNSSDFEGTGVGLALVHRIVTKHGGKIWAEAAVNEGATFYFTLN